VLVVVVVVVVVDGALEVDLGLGVVVVLVVVDVVVELVVVLGLRVVVGNGLGVVLVVEVVVVVVVDDVVGFRLVLVELKVGLWVVLLVDGDDDGFGCSHGLIQILRSEMYGLCSSVIIFLVLKSTAPPSTGKTK